MPDSTLSRAPGRRGGAPLVAAARAVPAGDITSTALTRSMPWQAEGWAYHDAMGEFAQAIDWQARGMSQVRLLAAEVTADGPVPMDPDTTAAGLMARFAGGSPGQSRYLGDITPHLQVPGEGWLVAERASALVPLALADWLVLATDLVNGLGRTWQVQTTADGRWRALAPESLPMRVWRPHPRRPWLATSPTQAAVPIMRRIELIDKRIIAMMVSRLAMNGIMLIPAEGTISVPEPWAQAPDPFVAMLVDIAAGNIADPGRASAAIPIPVRFASEWIENWRILKPEDALDEWLLQERKDELGRLGDALSISRERVTGGMGQSNHWSAWQMAEEEARMTFAPLAELACEPVTKAYLRPALTVMGEPLVGPVRGGPIVCWYDLVKLIARPDKRGDAQDLYDRGELSGQAYRRETAFDESDAPEAAELESWVWRQALKMPELVPTAIAKLTGASVPAPAQAPAGGGGASASVGPEEQPANAASPAGPPPTMATPPPAPGGVGVASGLALANGRR